MVGASLKDTAPCSATLATAIGNISTARAVNIRSNTINRKGIRMQ